MTAEASATGMKDFLIVGLARCSGLDRHAAALAARRLLPRVALFSGDALLLLLVSLGVAFRRARAVRPANVASEQRIARRHPETRCHIRPRALILRLLLRPHPCLDRRIEIHDLCDLRPGPWIKLFDPHDRNERRTPRGELVVDL